MLSSSRYPHEAPLVLITNEALPPGLARKLIEAANTHAAKMVSGSSCGRGPALVRYSLERGASLVRYLFCAESQFRAVKSIYHDLVAKMVGGSTDVVPR